MPQHAPQQWSDELREVTRQALYDVPVTHDGHIHMKRIDGGFGTFDALELIANTFELHVKGSDEVLSFADLDAVVGAGWVID